MACKWYSQKLARNTPFWINVSLKMVVYFSVDGTLAWRTHSHGTGENEASKHKGSQLVSSVAQSCPTLCDPMNWSMPGLPVHHQLPELAQTHVHRVSDAIQPPCPLLSPSPPAFNLSQHEGLFQWVSSSHQVAKVLELQLQHQSFQWIFRTDFL